MTQALSDGTQGGGGGGWGCYNRGGEVLGEGGTVFQRVVRIREDAMETFLFKVQGIYGSVS